MPESLRALIVVLAIGAPVLHWSEVALRAPVQPQAPRQAGHRRRRTAVSRLPAYWPIWLAITVLGFVIPSLALFLVAAALFLLMRLPAEPVPAAWFIGLLLAMPEVGLELPTFGLVQSFMALNFPLVLTLVLLGVSYTRKIARPVPLAIDGRALLAYALWLSALALLSASFTGFLRVVVINVLTIVAPFLAVRRGLAGDAELRRFLSVFVAMSSFLAVVALFEYGKGWLLYSSLPGHWGAAYNLSHYLARGDALRAQAATGQPIVLGVVLAMALAMSASATLFAGRPQRHRWVLLLLALGLFATISRGPWVAAVVGTACYVMTRPRGGLRYLLMFIAAGIAAVLVAAIVPGGQKLIALLPWIGDADPGSTAYRKNLLDSVVPLLLLNPITGVPDYDTRPELQALRQGEGIIDLVNSYIGVGVASGLVGLALFFTVHGVILHGLWRILRREQSEVRELARVLLAAYVTLLAAIATTSSISILPPITWAFAGAGSAMIARYQVRKAPRATRRGTRPASLVLDDAVAPRQQV